MKKQTMVICNKAKKYISACKSCPHSVPHVVEIINGRTNKKINRLKRCTEWHNCWAFTKENKIRCIKLT